MFEERGAEEEEGRRESDNGHMPLVVDPLPMTVFQPMMGEHPANDQQGRDNRHRHRLHHHHHLQDPHHKPLPRGPLDEVMDLKKRENLQEKADEVAEVNRVQETMLRNSQRGPQ